VDKPIVLVTGCSSGIGREAVSHLRRAGCLVVATARQVADIAPLAVPEEVECLALDVTDESARAAVVEDVLRRHGRIDALVNNAGYGANVTVEDTTSERLREMFEVNLIAAHDLARRVLPAMRARGRGRIVNVGSVAGHIAVPMMGPYCATKFALRALTEAMDNEVRRFGVRAVLIEPTWIATNFGTRTIKEGLRAADQRESPYAALYAKWETRRSSPHGPHPRVVGRAIVRACLSQSPRFHNFVPAFAKFANVSRRVLPDSWIDAGMRAYFRGR
jgi:NAD(P)-dependent dehydrogenase (short-subunit alcohol dehydrogenase family)